MRLGFPRARWKPKLPPIGQTSQSLPKPSHAFPDALRTSLTAIKESADAFPPLKTAVGAIVTIWDVAERAKHSKSDARGIAVRTQQILDVVVDAVPDPLEIPPSMLQSIERFTLLLEETKYLMEEMVLTGRVSRIVHLNRNERVLRDIRERLDAAYGDFLAASALRVEVTQAEIVLKQRELAAQQLQTYLQVSQILQKTNTTINLTPDLLFYSRLSVFLGRP
ncbi:hypothetical protein FB45DRAFT_935295 [Roridomyces roridus]|uniref:Uncharacterized protein n=1 Tax=Roridomyces roridus TaxID=1738132 RepID=A0AAD7BBA8_9AGAR|nr:hypothetical protein FB45DRAFT_935295 [Roridomyces roridus]